MLKSIYKLFPKSVRAKILVLYRHYLEFHSFLYRVYYAPIFKERIIKLWEKNGKPMPVPHQVKQVLIQEYQKKSGIEVLVETGTYMGDMIEAQKKVFKTIYSVELGLELFKKAELRFKKYNHIRIIQGDSAKVLSDITKDLKQPAIFFLDGHYSQGNTALGDTECPIFGEIDAIFKSNDFDNIILVDDANYFDGTGDYPSIDELTKYIKIKNAKYDQIVKNNTVVYEKRDSAVIQ